jgi:adenosine deaminase
VKFRFACRKVFWFLIYQDTACAKSLIRYLLNDKYPLEREIKGEMNYFGTLYEQTEDHYQVVRVLTTECTRRRHDRLYLLILVPSQSLMTNARFEKTIRSHNFRVILY